MKNGKKKKPPIWEMSDRKQRAVIRRYVRRSRRLFYLDVPISQFRGNYQKLKAITYQAIYKLSRLFSSRDRYYRQ